MFYLSHLVHGESYPLGINRVRVTFLFLYFYNAFLTVRPYGTGILFWFFYRQLVPTGQLPGNSKTSYIHPARDELLGKSKPNSPSRQGRTIDVFACSIYHILCMVDL